MNATYLATLCMIIAAVSFLGFWVENLWLCMTKGYMDNRNMRLPFLLGYGLAMVAIFLIFGTPQQPRFFTIAISIESRLLRTMAFFLIACLCVSLGEIALGTFVERTCGIVWWNYTRLPMHITKYTSVPTTCAFGTLITVFMGCFFMPLCHWFSAMSPKSLICCAAGLMLLLLADFVHSARDMYRNRSLSHRWRIDLSHTRLHRLWISQHPL